MRVTPEFAFLLLCAAAISNAQSAPAFEVASVKLATSGDRGVYTYPGGRVAFHGCHLRYLIQVAFNLQDFQISGPAWLADDRYDIEAKPPASSKSSHSNPAYAKTPPNEEQRQMLQSLLAERFQLKYHRENREGSVYLLVRTNRALKMQDSKDKNEFPWSGSLAGGLLGSDGMAGINESMDDLASRLSQYLGRPVLNRTELPGSYDFRVSYSSPDGKPDVISMIFATLQELGLKLESSKGPVEHIVIDHAEKPSAN